MRFALFFLLYGSVQFYCAAKINHGLGLTGWGRWFAYAWALAMTAGPLLVWRLERCAECQDGAMVVAWAVYGWMGFSFLFFVCGLLLDAYRGLALLGYLPRPDAATSFILLTLAASALWVWGFHSSWEPKVERIVIRSDKLPAKADGLRIVQISDVHLGLLIGRLRLAGILSQISDLNPDMLVSTGDLVDAQAHHLDGLSSLFASYHPRLGKFAITGNHESYAGLGHAIEFHERAGFEMLRGKAVEVGGIVLAGVDDPAVYQTGWANQEITPGEPVDEAWLLGALSPERFVLLLKHQPRVNPAARFDLQLSGHTHAGQIYPFRYLVRLVYRYVEGLHTLNNERQLYVSRGTGTWGPPIRVLAPPEITLIELRRP
jgi:predicted MPP superfamily phosphohydrolase